MTGPRLTSVSYGRCRIFSAIVARTVPTFLWMTALGSAIRCFEIRKFSLAIANRCGSIRYGSLLMFVWTIKLS